MASEPEDDEGVLTLALSADEAYGRIDKLLAARLPDLSRARIQALIGEGRVSRDGAPVTDVSAPAVAGEYRIEIPAPVSAIPRPEAIQHGLEPAHSRQATPSHS